MPCPDAPVAVVVRRFAFLGHEEAAKFSQIGEVPTDWSQGRFVSFCISWTWGSFNFQQIGGKLPNCQLIKAKVSVRRALHFLDTIGAATVFCRWAR